MQFSFDRSSYLRHTAEDFPLSCSCWAHLSRQWTTPLDEIDHRQHRKCAVGILGQSTIAGLGKSPEVLQSQERMLDLGAHTRLAPIDFSVPSTQLTVAVGTPVGEVLGLGRNGFESFPLLSPTVGTVAVETGFFTVEQIRIFLAVMDVRGRDAGAVDQATVAVYANMDIHAKVPQVPLLGLVHLRVTGLVLILDRGWRSDQRGTDNRTALQPHAIFHQQFTNLGEQGDIELMSFQQMVEVEQGRGIGDASTAQIEAAELAKHGGVVEGFFAGFIRQIEPVGNTVHAQHAFQANRRTPIARSRVVRFNQLTELRPRHQRVHARKKFRFARGATMFLEPSRSPCGLLHPVSPCDRITSSDTMTKKSFTPSLTYSAFQ
jgi:hypothetical protein